MVCISYPMHSYRCMICLSRSATKLISTHRSVTSESSYPLTRSKFVHGPDYSIMLPIFDFDNARIKTSFPHHCQVLLLPHHHNHLRDRYFIHHKHLSQTTHTIYRFLIYPSTSSNIINMHSYPEFALPFTAGVNHFDEQYSTLITVVPDSSIADRPRSFDKLVRALRRMHASVKRMAKQNINSKNA